MTDNMTEFIEHNGKFKIIEGYMVNTKLEPLSSTLEDKYGVKYIFTDNTALILSTKDVSSSNYMPVWELD